MNVLSIATQKGGVGKTATAVSLADALTQLGKRVLLVDLDHQANATTCVGVEPDADALISSLIDREELAPIQTEWGFDLAPSSEDLNGAETYLSQQATAITRVKTMLRGLPYDWVVLDCAPGVQTLHECALAASTLTIAPFMLAAESISGISATRALHRQVQLFQEDMGVAPMQLVGLLPTMTTKNLVIERQFMKQLHKTLPDVTLLDPIPTNVTIREAHSLGQPVTRYAPKSKAAQAYTSLARHLEDTYGQA